MSEILLSLKKKFKIFFNYFLGPALFIWLSVSIYHTISRQENWEQSWHEIKNSFYGPQSWKFIFVIFLMLFNWGFEAIKWQILVRHIQPLSFFTSFKAIMSGVSFSLNTPNRMGEYVGRVLYLEEGNRLRSVTITFVGSISQLIITFVSGLIGMVYLRHHLHATNNHTGLSVIWINVIIYGSTIVSLGLILLYYKLSWIIKLIEKIPLVAKYSFFIQKLEDFEWKELSEVLLFSLLRYCIFILQYALLFQVFEVHISWTQTWCLTSVMFLIMAVVPSIALAELGLRGKVSIALFGLFSTNTLGIIFTATGVWLINLVIPALAGSLFIIGIKLFGKIK